MSRVPRATRSRVLAGEPGFSSVAVAAVAAWADGWYGFNLDPARTKSMLDKLDAAFAKAGRKRGKDFQIIVTPPMSMAMDAMQGYAEVGVDRVIVNLGGQKPEQVDKRLTEIASLAKKAA